MKAFLLQLVNDCFDDVIFIAFIVLIITYLYLLKGPHLRDIPHWPDCPTCAECRLPYTMANIHKSVLNGDLINMWSLD
jgi:hypothetical protein